MNSQDYKELDRIDNAIREMEQINNNLKKNILEEIHANYNNLKEDLFIFIEKQIHILNVKFRQKILLHGFNSFSEIEKKAYGSVFSDFYIKRDQLASR